MTGPDWAATGPEHYREAEVQAEQAAREIDKGYTGMASLGLAQVHATLALAAKQDNQPAIIVSVSGEMTPADVARLKRAISDAQGSAS